MSNTVLSDMIVPSVFAPYVTQVANDTNAFLTSGFVANSPVLSAKLAGGGSTFNAPHFKSIDLGYAGANASTDDSTVRSTAKKMATADEVAVRLERNDTWSASDLVASIAGADPLANLGSQIARAVNKWRTNTLVAQISGIVNDTNMNSSVNDISGGTGAAAVFSTGALIDTLSAWGDKGVDAQTALIMHSDVYRFLMKQNLITFVPTAAQNLGFGTYLGFSVVVDDQVGKAGAVYTVYLAKAGSISMGMGSPRVPVAVLRDEQAANGGGVETLTFRDQYTFHVEGTAYTAGGTNPVDATLATAGSWSIVYPAKAVGLAALVCKLA
jgi:hypothetical protein